jgi:hypothetical protein
MNLQNEKLNLIQTIIGLQDKNLVLELKKFLETAMVNSEPEMKPMSLETFYAIIAASEKAMEEGDFISHEDLKKEIKMWGRKK